MRLIRDLGLMMVLAVCFGSCFKAPEFPIIPQIGFKNIEFADVADLSKADTLKVTISFKDGDGDLGLDATETEYPFNDKFFFVETDGTPGYFSAGDVIQNNSPKFNVYVGGQFIKFSEVPLITYKTKREAAINDPAHDTLPDFITPYSCTNWEVVSDPVTALATDTLYFQINPNNNNIFIDFFVEQNDGSFALFDWAEEFPYPNCYVNGFSGRFPILSKDLSRPTAQEGTIRYSMPSAGWNTIFGIKNMKVQITIQDRALHRSNTVISEKFQLKGI